MQYETKNVSLETMDKQLTKDWEEVCVGRYSIKLPPEFYEPDIDKFESRFDRFKLTLFKNKSQDAFEQMIRAKKAEIESLPKIEGLKTNFHAEIDDEPDTWLVAYRSGGDSDPFYVTNNLLHITGYKKIKDNILMIDMGSADGLGLSPPEDRDEMNELFKKEWRTGYRILSHAEPAKTLLGKFKPGHCLGNVVVITAEPKLDKMWDEAGVGVPHDKRAFDDGTYFGIAYHYDSPKPDAPQHYYQGILERSGYEFGVLNTNQMHGSYMVEYYDDGSPLYDWRSEDWLHAEKRSFDKPNLGMTMMLAAERYDYDAKKIETVFENIVASIHLRQ